MSRLKRHCQVVCITMPRSMAYQQWYNCHTKWHMPICWLLRQKPVDTVHEITDKTGISMIARLVSFIVLIATSVSGNATLIDFTNAPLGNKGLQYSLDNVLFLTTGTNTVAIRSDCPITGNCLASLAGDVLYGWLIVELPTAVNSVSFDFYTSMAQLFIAGHNGSPAIDAKVTEQHFAASDWWQHVTLDSALPFDYVTLSSITSDRYFNNRPSIYIDSLRFPSSTINPSSIPLPSSLWLLFAGVPAILLMRNNEKS